MPYYNYGLGSWEFDSFRVCHFYSNIYPWKILTLQRLCSFGTVQDIKIYTPEISLHLMWLI